MALASKVNEMESILKTCAGQTDLKRTQDFFYGLQKDIKDHYALQADVEKKLDDLTSSMNGGLSTKV